MKKSMVFLSLILFTICKVNAQTEKASSPKVENKTSKNLISFNTGFQYYSQFDGIGNFFLPELPVSYKIVSLGIGFQRQISDKISIGADISYKKFVIDEIPFALSAINIEPNAHFYVSKMFKGFYIPTYIGMNLFQSDFGDSKFLYYGVGVGYKYQLNEKVIIDINFKPGLEFSIESDNSSQALSNKIGIGVGYRF